jgi:hypothetical protein
VVRHRDQAARDRRRRVFIVNFPRTVTTAQVQTFLATLAGLATPRVGLVGRDAVVFEVVATRTRISHRLRLPAPSATYYLAQLRASVAGVTIQELEPADKGFALPRLTAARELRRVDATKPLAISDAAATSRTVLAAVTELARGQTAVWQWVIGGGSPSVPTAQAGALGASIMALLRGVPAETPSTRRTEAGVVRGALRIGAVADSPTTARELVARLRRAAASVSVPGSRITPRLLPDSLVVARVAAGATPLVSSPMLVSPTELVALLGWPIEGPVVPGVVLGGSPQLPVGPLVPRSGRVLGDATMAPTRPVAQSVKAATEHSLYVAPTGSGKTWLAAQVALADIEAGRGCLVIDPKRGSLISAILDRLPESAIGRTIVVDPTDETRPVPLPLLAHESGGGPELAADNLVALLRHRYRDLGPRSSDILSSSLYALARVPDATLFDLLPLWTNAQFRASVVQRSASDPVLASFFGWFDGLAATERNFVLAAPMNKIRPLLQRPVVRNVLAAPRSTFTVREAIAKGWTVLVNLPEGALGPEATELLGQVVLMRLWAAVQSRSRADAKRPFFVTVDEAPRFVDQPTDLGDMLARSREYGVGVTLITQSLAQLPTALRDVALNSARTKVAFQSSATDARRLADEFGPLVTPDMFTALGSFEAIGVVSLGGSVSEPFTFRTRPLGDVIRGRAAAVRAASRAQWGVPRAEIEAGFTRRTEPPKSSDGPVGRRSKGVAGCVRSPVRSLRAWAHVAAGQAP